MAEEELKDIPEDDTLEQVWDDRSLWNEEEIGDTFPEFNRWDDKVKDLLSETDPRPKEIPGRQDPVVDLKAVKPKPPVAEAKTPVTGKGPVTTVSNKQLLMLIHKYKAAEKICEITHMPLQTLQQRVAYLSYRLKRYIEVEGLYRDTTSLKMTQEGILIPKGHLVDTGFKVGDLFTVGFKDHFIMLARHQK